jgi:proteasome assembly chaperone (PAC2) family protein
VCAFKGWNDGGEGASGAIEFLRDRWDARVFAGIDPEEFYDFQVSRPNVRLEDGRTRRIDWPANDFLHARVEGGDIVLLLGIEPNTRWRTFAGAVVEVAQELGAGLLVTLGAFLADVPHTLPAPVVASSSDPDVILRLGVEPTRYEGPTGIVGVVHDAATAAGLSSVSLWAAAPHYVGSGSNPRIAVALLHKLGQLLEIEMETDQLAVAGVAWERQVDEAIEDDDDLQGYVRRLEQLAGERTDLGPAATGEALAQELERFLRDQRSDGAD